MLIIGITGTDGSGKGTVVEYLQQKGFKQFSVRLYLAEEAKRRGIVIENRDTLHNFANELRRMKPSYLADALYEQALASGGDSVLESLRNPAEVVSLREKGNFVLFATDADIHTRYERIAARKSVTDQVSFEEFKAQNARELSNTDPTKQNIAACIPLADYTFENNGTKEELWKAVESALQKI